LSLRDALPIWHRRNRRQRRCRRGRRRDGSRALGVLILRALRIAHILSRPSSCDENTTEVRRENGPEDPKIPGAVSGSHNLNRFGRASKLALLSAQSVVFALSRDNLNRLGRGSSLPRLSPQSVVRTGREVVRRERVEVDVAVLAVREGAVRREDAV